MKRLAIIFMITVLSLTVIPHSVSAIQYGIDVLEPGNPGGWTMSYKTWDNEWAMAVTEEVYVDVWLKDVPAQLVSGGFWIDYNPDQVSVVSVDIYDGNDLPGPWTANLSNKFPDVIGPGSYFVFLGGLASPEVGGDIILGRVTFRAESAGDATIAIIVDDMDTFDTVVGRSSIVYDSEIPATAITIHQTIEPCCTRISPDPLKLFAGKTVQFLANKSGTCNASSYLWSDDCVHAAIGPATGLFTAEANAAEESCSVCVTDAANPSSCIDAGCNPLADCCAYFSITNDGDDDGVANEDDNCPNHPNGPALGTCVYGTAIGQACTDNGDCGANGFCSMNQEDNFPPGGNGIGEACECEGDFNADGDVDGSDASLFKSDFGRSSYSNPCPSPVTSTTTTAAP